MKSGYAIKTYVPAPDIVSVEHMAAADLIAHARRAGNEALRLTPEGREEFARKYEALIEELRIGALLMRSADVPHLDDVPEFLRPESQAIETSPTLKRIRLLSATEALTHD